MTAAAAGRPRLLVISQDRLDGQVAGTSIRALELARALPGDADVSLAAVGQPPASLDGLPCTAYDPQDGSSLRDALAGADAVLTLPQWPSVMRALRRSGRRLIFDLYVPQTLETVGGFPGSRPVLRRAFTELATDRLVDALRIGDQFLCASEKQRDLWLGVMLAERLLDVARHDADPSLRSLIDVVPFGLPATPPRATGQGGARDRIAGVDPGDELILWNGGLWPWLDADTAIRAVARLAERRRRVRLVFMGAASQVPAQRAAAAARSTAAALGLLDRVVFFNDAWVPYEQRADWLLEADCAISTHEDHLETRFAFRTRLLDCFWSGLPVVCTGGDELADLVEREGLGEVVAPGDVDATARALERVLDRGRAAYAPALERVAATYTWPVVAAPLRRQLSGLPPPPVHGRALRPGHATRRAVYAAARTALDAVGLRDWPRL
jgi:glycosyltransferase involved in cell wall biosynthesis